MTLQPFEKWVIYFVGPIQPQGKNIGAWYIITMTEYLTQWVEAQPVKDCTGMATMKFLFKYVLMWFGCPNILMSDHGMHFLNKMINVLTEEFQVYHHKSTPYHPQANGTVEAFNKVLENALTKVCNPQWSDWNLRIPAVLWAYRTTCRKLTRQIPFRLVYGVEAVMPMEYNVPSLCIAALIGMSNCRALEERLVQLAQLEEERLLARFHQ